MKNTVKETLGTLKNCEDQVSRYEARKGEDGFAYGGGDDLACDVATFILMLRKSISLIGAFHRIAGDIGRKRSLTALHHAVALLDEITNTLERKASDAKDRAPQFRANIQAKTKELFEAICQDFNL